MPLGGLEESPRRPEQEERIVTQEVALVVNGVARTVDVEPRKMLVQLLREDLGLTGTHVGCDTSQCGACTVLVDGHAVKSCTMLALQADGSAVTTIEGLAPSGGLHPIQTAFWEHHGLQCGFCTPGMIMTAADLLQRESDPDDATVRHALEGNFCRCTGYHNIVKAIQAAAATMRGEVDMAPAADEPHAAPGAPSLEDEGPLAIAVVEPGDPDVELSPDAWGASDPERPTH
jgi:carbon-monoxide dehydrogenase small subunit